MPQYTVDPHRPQPVVPTSNASSGHAHVQRSVDSSAPVTYVQQYYQQSVPTTSADAPTSQYAAVRDHRAVPNHQPSPPVHNPSTSMATPGIHSYHQQPPVMPVDESAQRPVDDQVTLPSRQPLMSSTTSPAHIHNGHYRPPEQVYAPSHQESQVPFRPAQRSGYDIWELHQPVDDTRVSNGTNWQQVRSSRGQDVSTILTML